MADENKNTNSPEQGAQQPQEPSSEAPQGTPPVQPIQITPQAPTEPTPAVTPEPAAQPAPAPQPTPIPEAPKVEAAPAPEAPKVEAQPQPQPQEAPPVAPAAPPAQAPVQKTAPQPAGQPIKPQVGPLKPGQKPTRKPPNPKKLIFGCTGCGGFALLAFIVLVLVFVGQTTSSGENPMAQSLGVSTASLTNTLILLVNLIFGGLSLLLFVLATIGVFRIFMARKDDKVTRKKGLTMAGIAGVLLFIFVFMWVGIYMFMTSRQVAEIRATGIVTEPAQTLGLTAPINITFDGSNLPNSSRYDVLSYLWDFGDGNTSTVPLTSNTYKDKGTANGRYDVQLQVTKRDRSTGEESIDTYSTVVTIANVELGAIFSATPSKGPAPLTVEFDASDSAAPAGQIVSYDWDFNNDNVFTDASGVEVTETFEQLGTYTVNLRITDNTGQFKISSQEIVVSGENLPVANINIPTTTGQFFVGQQYSFEGGQSSSPTGTIEKYEWQFGDGTAKATTRTATHIFSEAGEYEIVLTVTDEEGTSSESSEKIKVEIPESAPIANITTVPGPNGNEGDVIVGVVPFEVSFDGTGSNDPDGNIVDYQWDFDGDGSDDAAGERTTFVYKESGIYNATLTVVDAENNESKAVMVVRVSSQPLQARIVAEPLEGVVPLTVTFDASSSAYPTGQIVSYEWDFGDGSAKRIDVSKVTYKYTKIGTFTASVTAIASDNTRSTSQIPVNVRPVSLTACFTALPTSGEAPLEVEFDPKCSAGTVAKYSWDFGDGDTTKTRKPTHVFNAPGSYSVTLEVSDNQNVIDTFSENILVTGSL